MHKAYRQDISELSFAYNCNEAVKEQEILS